MYLPIKGRGLKKVALTNEELLSAYRYMVMGRMVEEAVTKIKGNYHPAEGEEAVIVGTFYNLRKDDVIVPHYRGALIAYIMRGASLRRLFAGILGKETSYNCGRYRGDIWGPLELNIIGMYAGALGPTISLATGAALAAKLKKTDSVAVVSFGDGTSNRGDFHEAINLASVLKLPIVYVCQNNQFAVSTPACKALGCHSVADRAIGYGIPGVNVDGNDVVAVHEAVKEAIQRARKGNGPTLIEALTYRVGGHMVADPATYRSAEEAEEWKKKDPIVRLQKKLINIGVLTEREIEGMRKNMGEEISAAVKQAEEDPWPGEQVLGLDDVFAPAN
jgi:TPP-dependent pyruvate/acetoin dehydrogenase alpha subunit